MSKLFRRKSERVVQLLERERVSSSSVLFEEREASSFESSSSQLKRFLDEFEKKREGRNDDSQLEADYVEALQLGQILVAYARLVMIGPGGIGKTSLLNGLKNKPLPLANSTQLAETSTVRPQNWSRAIEDPESPWTDVTEDDETDEIVGLVQLVKNVTSGQTRSARFFGIMGAAAGAAIDRFMRRRRTQSQSDSVFQNEAMQTVDEILSRAVTVGKENPRVQAPESEVMLHVWDCGGQPVFLDVLPPFLTSRSMFMLMFDASKNLREECVAISHQDGVVVQSEQYHNTTTIELLLQWMATIHANLAKKDNADANQEHVPKFPRILPIGTHGDLPAVQSRKEEILQEISSECEDKAFAYLVRPGVIVDNTKAGRGENEDPAFKDVRKEAYKFANENLKIPTPITWVLFRKVFKKLAATKPIIPLHEVIKIAVECGVREEAVESVLKFYHELAVFFHYAHIPSLKKYVIADVQLLINQLAKILALEGFESNRSSLLWKPLREKGILVQPLCEEVWKGSKLPPQALLDLMEDFLLLAPIHSKVYPQHPGREYFIPSVLKPFNPEQDTVTPTVALKKAAPLHLRFSTSYIPPGFFSRLATVLIKEEKCHVRFKDEAVYSNQISVYYGEASNDIDKITISQVPSSIEIEISRVQRRLHPGHPLFSSTCREVLELILKCSDSILEWLPSIKVSPAFVCEQCSCDEGQHQNFWEFDPNKTTCLSSSLRCSKGHTGSLSTAQQYWLDISSTEKGLCSTPLTLSELNDLAGEVPQVKIKHFVECLEMTNDFPLEDHTSLKTELERWYKEIVQVMDAKYIRAELVHCLRIVGLKELAKRLLYGQPLVTMASGITSRKMAPQAELSQNPPFSTESPLVTGVTDIATKRIPQEPLTETDLRQCSDFITESSDLSLLATMLHISDAEFESVCTRYKKPQEQAYQMLYVWNSSLQSRNKRKALVVALNATNSPAAANRLLWVELLESDTGVPKSAKKDAPKLTADDLMQCSRFIDESANLTLLAPILNISDDELENICSRYKKPQGQAYQMLQTWYSSTPESSNKREELAAALDATNFSAASKRLEATSTHVPALVDLLKYVKTAKWYRLGIYLGLDDRTTLAMIDQDCNNSEDKLRKMFQVWLQVERELSWSKVVQALNDLELTVLAADIKEKFCV